MDIGEVLDALSEATKAQDNYNREYRKFEESGGYSWDWSGTMHDELKAAKDKARLAAETYIREIVRDEIAKAEGRQA